MKLHTAIVVDDMESHREGTARLLRRSGWATYTAHNGASGAALSQQILAAHPPEQVVVITDLHMPWSESPHDDLAGTHLALWLRVHMDRATLPRVPIIALTALTDPETLFQARAFGCDAVLEKPATLDLPARIQAALASPNPSPDPAHTQIMAVLRAALVAKLPALDPAAHSQTASISLSIADLNAALLVYRRHGLVGLGESRLARYLAPEIPETLRRGEETAAMLHTRLELLAQRGETSAQTLLAELNTADAPEQHLAISKSTYYRQRQVASTQLLALLTQKHAAHA